MREYVEISVQPAGEIIVSDRWSGIEDYELTLHSNLRKHGHCDDSTKQIYSRTRPAESTSSSKEKKYAAMKIIVNSRMIRRLTLRDHATGKRRVDCVPTARSQIFHGCSQKEGQPRLSRSSNTCTHEALPTISLRIWRSQRTSFSLVVSPVGAIQNQQKKSSLLTKHSKRAEGRGMRKTKVRTWR